MYLRNIKIRRKQKLVLITLSITVLCTIIILQTELSPDLYFIHWEPLENITCYNLEMEDVLPSGDDIKFSSNSIFFHETSCKGSLDARQACSIESAAKAHPDWNINVLFTAPASKVTLKNCSRIVKEYENVNFYRIHPAKYAKGTPLEEFVVSGALNRTRWRISHTSDVLRYLSLYKWGGVYLDMDVLVVKSFNSLAKNWSARESKKVVAAGAMAFSTDRIGRLVAEIAIRDIKENYRGDMWGHNGPGVVTRTLQKICSVDRPIEMDASTCLGFEVYSPALFYPIEWAYGKDYFVPGTIDPKIKKEAYVYHVWNHATANYHVAPGSPYDTLAKKYCPVVYETYKGDFG